MALVRVPVGCDGERRSLAETRSTKEPHGLEAVPRRVASEAGFVRHARGEA